MELEEGVSGKRDANVSLRSHVLILTWPGFRQQSPQPQGHPASPMGQLRQPGAERSEMGTWENMSSGGRRLEGLLLVDRRGRRKEWA